MKGFLVISVLFAAIAAAASAEFCYNEINSACSSKTTDPVLLKNCTAKYGRIEESMVGLQTYVNAQIEASFEYLLMSSFFGNYQANRDGFKSLYRKLSDKAWDDAFDLIKFITKRGGMLNFGELPKKSEDTTPVLDLNELNSLGKALVTQKRLADEVLRLHTHAQDHLPKRDGAIAHYLEERFMESQTETIRNLAGYITDLKQLLSSNDESVSVYIFDEYLQKAV